MAISIGSSLKKANATVAYTVDDQELKGGFRCVSSVEERNKIPIGGRRGGMIVRVVIGEEVTDYTLPGNNLSNAAWKVQEMGGGAGGGGGTDVPPEGDWVATSGGRMSGPLMLTETGRINFNEKALMYTDGLNVMYQLKEKLSLLVFHNGVENTIEVDVNTGQITALREVALASDASLKENVETIDDSLDITAQLRGVIFDWINGGKSMGVIAQELQKVLPYLVYRGSNGKIAVRYSALTGLFIENINQLNRIVKDQSKLIDELTIRLDELTK